MMLFNVNRKKGNQADEAHLPELEEKKVLELCFPLSMDLEFRVIQKRRKRIKEHQVTQKQKVKGLQNILHTYSTYPGVDIIGLGGVCFSLS